MYVTFRPRGLELTCAICADAKPSEEFAPVCAGLWDSTAAGGGGWTAPPCTSGAAHGAVCKACVRAHVSAELSSKGMTSLIECPMKGAPAAPVCTGKMCPADMARLGVPAAQCEMFERNLLHAAMDEHPRFRWCAKPGVRTRMRRLACARACRFGSS